MILSETHVCTDCKTLCELIANAKPKIIGIDGTDGTGKSYLSKRVASTLNFGHVEVDKFINRNQDTYLANLDSEHLKNATNETLSKHQGLVLDGICLRAVLENIDVVAEFHVYVQTISEVGNLQNSDVIGYEPNSERHGNQSWLSPLARELGEYHNSYQPRAKSNVIYQRIVT